MGLLRIEFRGSFVVPGRITTKEFSAMPSGHAVAVDDAIKWLQGLLPDVVSQDIELRDKKVSPRDNFTEADRRSLFNKEKDKPGYGK